MQAFDIHTDIANLGTTTFNGEVGMAIFDENYTFVDFAATQTGLSLAPGMHFTDGLTFSNPGLVSLLPGNYNAILYYRVEGGNWMAAAPGSYTNLLPFKVYYSSDIELYSDFLISTGGEITANQPFSVKADIINNGSLKFTGDFQVALYDMQGNFADLVETQTGADLDPGYYYDDVEFHSNGISVTPGTYLMALLYRPDAGDWTLSGSSSYPNPVKIIVKATPLLPDKYESNNAEEEAYELVPVFSENSATVTTEGSNLHVGTDLDFYRLSLEGGFDYTFKTRVHDSYNSGNGETYSADVIWSWYANGSVSDVFDDLSGSDLVVQNGGDIFFAVAPYFEGETGSYLLDIQITRSPSTSTVLTKPETIIAYPNPATDRLNIEAGDMISLVEMVDYPRKNGHFKESSFQKRYPRYFGIKRRCVFPTDCNE